MPKPNIDPWKHGVGAVGGAGHCQKPFQRYDLLRVRFRQFLQCRGTMPEQIITLGIPKKEYLSSFYFGISNVMICFWSVRFAL